MDQNKPIPQMEILDTAEGGHVAVQWEPAQQLDGAFGKLCTYKFHASPLKCILELAQRLYVLTGSRLDLGKLVFGARPRFWGYEIFQGPYYMPKFLLQNLPPETL
ncbi:hypothetical protein T4E_11249 [Trichinella pseudospiralis]|uniref:Uncharacterized protein n=1 Tax=Trichinella pseudospiralis TaxID=6337 RepID=A0A0V0Y798_TRIPS|nr:hypothetical protein T4E_11249 [Trichinella pseudospiralis]